jgi:hypothetical protein
MNGLCTKVHASNWQLATGNWPRLKPDHVSHWFANHRPAWLLAGLVTSYQLPAADFLLIHDLGDSQVLSAFITQK